MDQAELTNRVRLLLLGNNIIDVDGLPSAQDALGTWYVTLASGCVRETGTMVTCYYTDSTDLMWRHFSGELLYWLAGRDRIFWRNRPEIVEGEIVEVDFDTIANREAVMDGLEQPRAAQYRRTRYYIHCRLTAYKS